MLAAATPIAEPTEDPTVNNALWYDMDVNYPDGSKEPAVILADGRGTVGGRWFYCPTTLPAAGEPFAKPTDKVPDADTMFRISRRSIPPGAGMKDTVFNLRPGDEARVMQGHNFDGSPMLAVHTPASIECAGGLHTTANDMARWMKWHLDRLATTDRELQLLDHAAYLYRDGLTAVTGMDDAGPIDAMGLGWVINMPTANRPSILQKSGGLQGS